MTIFKIGDDFAADIDHVVAMYVPDNHPDGPFLVIVTKRDELWKRMPLDEALAAIKAFYEAKRMLTFYPVLK